MRGPIAINRALAATALVVVAVVAAVAAGLLGSVEASATTPAAPYTDPSAVGYLGVCNQQGHQITSGSIDTAPLAWEAVSSAAAPSAVSGSGRTATLFAYQPVNGVEPSEWSGEQITGTSEYSNPAHPIAVSTDRDLALSQFLDAFPAKWDGFIELRMILDSPGVEAEVFTYPALNLYVSGDTWHAVGGGSVNCSAGRATSDEATLPNEKGVSGSANGKGASGSKSSSRGSGSSHDSSVTGGSPSHGKGSGSAITGSDKLSATAASKSSDTGPLIAVAAIAVLLVAMAPILIRTRRRRGSLKNDSKTPTGIVHTRSAELANAGRQAKGQGK